MGYRMGERNLLEKGVRGHEVHQIGFAVVLCGKYGIIDHGIGVLTHDCSGNERDEP